MHIHNKYDIDVSNSFIEKFAKRYIEQRSKKKFTKEDLESSLIFKNNGFDV